MNTSDYIKAKRYYEKLVEAYTSWAKDNNQNIDDAVNTFLSYEKEVVERLCEN